MATPLELIAEIQTKLTALAAAIQGQTQPEQPGTLPVAQAGNNLTLKSSSGKESVTTGTARLTVGMMVKFANGRSTPVMTTDDGITFTTREPAADTPAKLKALENSTLKVESVPGDSGSQPTPAPGNPNPQPVPAAGFVNLHGVNLSGLGSNPYVENARVGTNFRAPEQRHFDKYAGLGCRLLRLPTALERFNETWDAYLPLVTAALDQAQAEGMQAIIDLHSYYRYWTKVPNGYQKRIGYDLTNYNGVTKEWRPIGTEGCAMSVAQHAALVGKIVNALKGHPAYLGIGLANEPHNADKQPIDVDALWLRDVQTHFDAAAAASPKHKIFVAGCAYSSCRQWQEKSDALKNLKDLNGQAVFEGHNYLDKNMTGGGNWKNPKEEIPIDNFINMVKPLVEWGQRNGKQVYIGEHGYPEGNASAEAATTKGLQYLTDNKVPSTQWCAGPGWPAGDVLALDDDKGTFKTNVNAVKQFFDKKV